MPNEKSVVVRFDATQTGLEWVSEDGEMTIDPEYAQTYPSAEAAQEVADTVEGAQVHTLAD